MTQWHWPEPPAPGLGSGAGPRRVTARTSGPRTAAPNPGLSLAGTPWVRARKPLAGAGGLAPFLPEAGAGNVPALRGDPSSGAEKGRRFLWAIALKEQKEAKVVV